MPDENLIKKTKGVLASWKISQKAEVEQNENSAQKVNTKQEVVEQKKSNPIYKKKK